MNNELINQINLFLEGENDLWDLISEFTYFNAVDVDLFNDAVIYMEGKEDEESLIVEVLLWSFKNSPIKDLNNSSNSFYTFLLSLENNDSPFYSSDIEWISNEGNISVYKKHNYLFVINSSIDDKYIKLPADYVNTTLYCVNCNEEIDVNDNLFVPSKTFFIIEKEN